MKGKTRIKLVFVDILLMGLWAVWNQSVVIAILTGSTMITVGLLEIREAIRAPRYVNM